MKERKNKFIKEKHVEYKRIVEGSRVAILCIHGFMGSPNQYRDIVPYIPENVSVYNMILDGHGGNVLDFGHASMKKWEENVEKGIAIKVKVWYNNDVFQEWASKKVHS